MKFQSSYSIPEFIDPMGSILTTLATPALDVAKGDFNTMAKSTTDKLPKTATIQLEFSDLRMLTSKYVSDFRLTVL
ncbi:hypothetical protein T08_1536 [Trichinella sp. T8]|nr:hypothetical protein T08_10154 [Trichinella sp. T8]KRZ82886.1 hypothetical protein T08_1536 [Trichinella sp. T8]